MSQSQTQLNESQRQSIRWLVSHRKDGNGYLERNKVTTDCGLTDGEFVSLIQYLKNCGHVLDIVPVDGAPYACHFMLSDTIDAEILKLDRPIARDYPSELKKWFFSKWWSIPFWVIIVGLPAIIGYVTMLRSIVRWINGND